MSILTIAKRLHCVALAALLVTIGSCGTQTEFMAGPGLTLTDNTFSVAGGGITSTMLADGGVMTADLANGSVGPATLANNSVTTAKIVDGAVNTAKLTDGAVTAAKLAPGAVSSASLANGSITSALIATGAVGTNGLADNAVSTPKIQDAAVTTAKLAANAVANGNLADGSVTTAKLVDNAITTAKVADASITTAKIAANAIDSTLLANNAVTTAAIAAGAVDNTKLASDCASLAKVTCNHMSIDGSGHIGVGTTMPTFDFEINATSGIRLGLQGNGGGRLTLTNDPSDNKILVEAFSSDATASAAELSLAGRNNADMPLISLHSTLATFSGNVAIGASASAARLTVGAGGTGMLPEHLVIDSGNGAAAAFPALDLSRNGAVAATLFIDGGAHAIANMATGDCGLKLNNQQLFISTDNGTTDAVVVDAMGNVGIATNMPTEKLTVTGNICASGTIGACSDERYKTNLQRVENALSLVERLRPVRFDWRRDAFPSRHFSADRQIGLIAQEVNAVVPEVVSTGRDGYLSVDYGRLTPLLVRAVQEQAAAARTLRSDSQAQITALKSELDRVRAEKDRQIAELSARLARLESTASHH